MDVDSGRGPPFGSPPPGEMAEVTRLHYELQFTEGISQRMRIPDTLKVAPQSEGPLQHNLPPHSSSSGSSSTLMHVPERILVAGDDGDRSFLRPRDLDLIQSVPPVDLLDMKAPPHVLTLTEQPLDSLETDHKSRGAAGAAATAVPPGSHSRARRERCHSENVPGRRGEASATPSPHAPLRLCPPLSTPEDANLNLLSATGLLSYIQSTTRRAYQQVLEVLDDGHRRAHLEVDMNLEESGLVDASSLRRQIVRLNRRLQLLEEENKERSRREMILYSATVAVWIINTWIWLRR